MEFQEKYQNLAQGTLHPKRERLQSDWIVEERYYSVDVRTHRRIGHAEELMTTVINSNQFCWATAIAHLLNESILRRIEHIVIVTRLKEQ